MFNREQRGDVDYLFTGVELVDGIGKSLSWDVDPIQVHVDAWILTDQVEFCRMLNGICCGCDCCFEHEHICCLVWSTGHGRACCKVCSRIFVCKRHGSPVPAPRGSIDRSRISCTAFDFKCICNRTPAYVDVERWKNLS